MSTVQGNTLTASMKGNHVVLEDTQGRISKITATDLRGTNGICTCYRPGGFTTVRRDRSLNLLKKRKRLA